MIDISLLRCLRERADYDTYRSHVPLNALEDRTRALIEDIDKYYRKFKEAEAIDFVLFRDLFFNHWHRGMTDAQIELFDKILNRVDVELHQDVKATMMNSLLELKFATDTANMIQHYHSGEEIQIIQQVQQLADQANDKLTRRKERTYEVPDFDELMADDLNNAGLRFRCGSLNRSIRPLRGGDFVIVAGRPDKGKTSFIADNATFFAQQCPKDRPILWLSNEGVRNNIIKRAIQASLGCTTPEMVLKHKNGTLMDEYHVAIGHPLALQIEDICGWTNFEVAELVEQVNPSVLILDMIDKVTFLGMDKGARTDQNLEEMYSWFREFGIAHEYVTLATSQISQAACDSPTTQMWPDDWMLKDSRTGKQGACDMIMMLGHNQDPQNAHYRYISAPKNKLHISGSPPLRSTVQFDADRSRFIDPH